MQEWPHAMAVSTIWLSIAMQDDAFTDGGLVTTPAAAKPAAPRPAAAKPAASNESDEDDIPLAARAAAKA